MTNKWTFNKTNDDVWRHDDFDTKEEAIQAGMTYAREKDWDSLFIGELKEIPVKSPMDADDAITRVAEIIDDKYGGDFEPGDVFLGNLKTGDYDRLQGLLDEAFEKWVKEREIRCHAFTIKKVECVDLPPKDGDNK